MIGCACVLRQNIEQRLNLLQELGLAGKYYESVLVRTESLLNKRRFQKALKLVQGICAKRERHGKHYTGTIDFLISLASPGWDQAAQDYYSGKGKRAIEYIAWKTITQLDIATCHLLEELRALYEVYQADSWREGKNTCEYDELTELGIKFFITPLFPEAVLYKEAEAVIA